MCMCMCMCTYMHMLCMHHVAPWLCHACTRRIPGVHHAQRVVCTGHAQAMHVQYTLERQTETVSNSAPAHYSCERECGCE